ncbi:hypothetical protein D3C87_1932810 [compost metagenome]
MGMSARSGLGGAGGAVLTGVGVGLAPGAGGLGFAPGVGVTTTMASRMALIMATPLTITMVLPLIRLA